MAAASASNVAVGVAVAAASASNVAVGVAVGDGVNPGVWVGIEVRVRVALGADLVGVGSLSLITLM